MHIGITVNEFWFHNLQSNHAYRFLFFLFFFFFFGMLQKFFCGGRLIFGPEAASLFLSTFLVAGPAIAFCIRILYIIKLRIKENENATPWYSLFFVGIALTVLVSKLSQKLFFHIFLSNRLQIQTSSSGYLYSISTDKYEFSTCGEHWMKEKFRKDESNRQIWWWWESYCSCYLIFFLTYGFI